MSAVPAGRVCVGVRRGRREIRIDSRDPTPNLRSNAFYILDESDSKVLAARNERVAVPIASITKLMTALVVLDADQPMDEVIAITRDDVRGTAGSRSRLAPGTRLTRADLLHLALMSSENRAAHALGRTYPGGLRACVRAMNDKAQVARHDDGALRRADRPVEPQRGEPRGPGQAGEGGGGESDDP